jgi:hypothetical protein
MSKYWLVCQERGQQIWNVSFCERKCINTEKKKVNIWSRNCPQTANPQAARMGMGTRVKAALLTAWGGACKHWMQHTAAASFYTQAATCHGTFATLDRAGLCDAWVLLEPLHNQRAWHGTPLTVFTCKLKQTLPLYPPKPLWPPPGFLPKRWPTGSGMKANYPCYSQYSVQFSMPCGPAWFNDEGASRGSCTRSKGQNTVVTDTLHVTSSHPQSPISVTRCLIQDSSQQSGWRFFSSFSFITL